MASQSDERFDRAPRTASEELLHRTLVHSHYLERLSLAEANKIRDLLRDEVLPDLIGKLVSRLERIQSRGYDSGIDRTKRWSDLVDGIQAIVDEGVTAARKMSIGSLKDLASYEAKWAADALKQSIPAEARSLLNIELELPAPNLLRELVTERPIAGHNVGDWWDSLSVDSANRIEREVRIGLAEGQSVPDIARRIRGTSELKGKDGVFEITTRHAQAIARNAATHVANQVSSEVNKANSDIVREEQWIATLDLRTCPICGSRDGQRWPVGEGPMPPAHPPGPNGGACRCRRIAVVLSLNEIMKAAGSKKRFKDFAPSTRASMNGQVPETTTYSEWLGGLEPDEIKDAIGATRADLFTSGKLSIDRMVDQSGRVLTLEQIAAREGLDF